MVKKFVASRGSAESGTQVEIIRNILMKPLELEQLRDIIIEKHLNHCDRLKAPNAKKGER
jgi:hypothetical protein